MFVDKNITINIIIGVSRRQKLLQINTTIDTSVTIIDVNYNNTYNN
jgi:hypothetical protein